MLNLHGVLLALEVITATGKDAAAYRAELNKLIAALREHLKEESEDVQR